MLNDTYGRLLSRPLRLLWAGWETTTFALQKAGWRLSAEQDFHGERMRIAMKHDSMNLLAMTGSFRFPYYDMVRDPRILEEIPSQVVQAMGRDVNIHVSGAMNWTFQAIDATPSYTTHRIEKLEDLAHFAAPLVRTKEIIIPNESVDDLMARILDLQQPARTERLREEMRDPEGLVAAPQMKFHAQILSLVA